MHHWGDARAPEPVLWVASAPGLIFRRPISSQGANVKCPVADDKDRASVIRNNRLNRNYFGAATCIEGTRGHRNRLYGSSVHPGHAGEGRAILGAPYGDGFVTVSSWFVGPTSTAAHEKDCLTFLATRASLKLAAS